ncbi:MAG: hypothetical protein WC453_01935 [Patescibacteria group bacterium]
MIQEKISVSASSAGKESAAKTESAVIFILVGVIVLVGLYYAVITAQEVIRHMLQDVRLP